MNTLKLDWISLIGMKDIAGLIKENDDETLKSLYTDNYQKVEHYVVKNSGSKIQAKDIFQESIIVMWRSVKKGRFEPKTMGEVNAYLFQVARNKWIDFLRSNEFKKTDYNGKENIESQELYDVEMDLHYEEQIRRIESAFSKLGRECQRLLKLFYYKKKSMKAISEILHIDAASSRNKKYRCMQRLRTIVQENNK